MPNRDDFLRKADMMSWARFLNSEEGQRGLRYLRLACPRNKESNEASLIRNAVGFDFWHSCIDSLEKLGEVPTKPEKQEDDGLEQ